MEELVSRALPVVRGLARRLAGNPEDGDALAQEAMVAALEGLPRYRGEAAFATWVCAIAVRRQAEHARAAQAERRVRQEVAREEASADPAEQVAEWDTARLLWDLVADLSPAYREALIAYATCEGAAEAAQSLGITVNAFRVRLHRARLALRDLVWAVYPEWREEVRYAES